jgi:hypothetical protein
MIGNVPVSVGMALALQIFVPGDPELLLIDRATVTWAKRSKFGVEFDTHEPKVAERITESSPRWSSHNMAHPALDKRSGQMNCPT